VDGIQTLAQTIQAAAAAAPSMLPTMKGIAMSDNPATPKAATHKELKEALVGASADFILAQLDAEATVGQAQSAWLKTLSEQNAALASEKAEAESRAAKAEANAAAKKTAPEPKRRGNPAVSGATSEGDEGGIDYRALAEERMKAKNCRWSEACLWVKRQYPESRAEFGAPPAA
jgi:hypothetical protein